MLIPWNDLAGMCGVILEAYREDARRFNELCRSFPQEDADKLFFERKKRQEENTQHQRNLEVARAGRNLNFWGNR